MTTLGAFKLKLMPTFNAEFNPLFIIRLALRAFHFGRAPIPSKIAFDKLRTALRGIIPTPVALLSHCLQEGGFIFFPYISTGMSRE
jgi:hypothetical protein